MAKINDTTTYPNTTPALTDHVPGTDVSNTANDANGETVTFTIDAILEIHRGELAATSGAGLIGYDNTGTNYVGATVSAVLGEIDTDLDGLADWVGLNPSDYQTVAGLPVKFFDAGGSASASRPTADVVIWGNHADEVPTNAGANDIYQLPKGTVARSGKTANYTITDDDMGSVIEATSGTLTFTLDTNANEAITLTTNTWRTVDVVNNSGNDLTIDGATGVTVNGVSGGSVTLADGGVCTVAKTGTDTWQVLGNVT